MGHEGSIFKAKWLQGSRGVSFQPNSIICVEFGRQNSRSFLLFFRFFLVFFPCFYFRNRLGDHFCMHKSPGCILGTVWSSPGVLQARALVVPIVTWDVTLGWPYFPGPSCDPSCQIGWVSWSGSHSSCLEFPFPAKRTGSDTIDWEVHSAPKGTMMCMWLGLHTLSVFFFFFYALTTSVCL